MKSVLFVCRGSIEQGLGHIMRTRSVAEATQGGASIHVAALGDEAILAPMLGDLPYSCLERDEDVLPLIDELDPELVVFDALNFDAEIFAQIHERCTTVSLSPIFDQLSKVHLAFTRAALPLHRRLSRTPGGPEMRIGLRYATIGEHCQRVPTDVYTAHLKQNRLAVAISMGGTDAPNKTLRILESIRSLPEPMLIWVLLGEGYQHSYERLVDCVRGCEAHQSPTRKLGPVPDYSSRHEIILARTQSSMWRILSGCSVAILAGGITTCEAAYAGVPSLIVLENSEQKYLIQELVGGGAAMYAGAPLESALPTLNQTLVYLHHNREMLLSMHQRAQTLIDEGGAMRMAEEILLFDPAKAGFPTVMCA